MSNNPGFRPFRLWTHLIADNQVYIHYTSDNDTTWQYTHHELPRISTAVDLQAWRTECVPGSS